MLGFTDTKGPFFMLCFIALAFVFVFVAVYASIIHDSLLATIAAHSSADISPIRRYSSVALFLGACLFGLPAGATAGAIYGLGAGVAGAVVFGMAGAAFGLVFMDTICRCMNMLKVGQIRESLLDDELLTPELQDALDELFEGGGSRSRGSIVADYISRNAADVPDNILLKSFVHDTELDKHAGERVRTQMASIRGLISREEASILLTRAAERIRDPDYKLKEFHADMVKCFPGASAAVANRLSSPHFLPRVRLGQR